MSDKPGFAACKRRYKVLKRCDQSDKDVVAEIAALEKEFPELQANPPPPLSSGVRATLEGGALVTSIENGGGNEAAVITASSGRRTTTTISQTNNDTQKGFSHPSTASIDSVTSPPSSNPSTKAPSPASAASNSGNPSPASSAEFPTSTSSAADNSHQGQEQDDVRQQIKHLQEMAQRMERIESTLQETTAAVGHNIKSADHGDDAGAEPVVGRDQKNKSASNSSNNNNLLERAALALRFYDAVYTFPRHCHVHASEAAAAVFAAVTCAVVHCTLFATLCDGAALLWNPVVWSALGVLARLASESATLVTNNSNASSGRRGGLVVVIGVLVTALSAVVRYLLCAVLSFSVYSVMALLLQAVGMKFPPRFCAEF